MKKKIVLIILSLLMLLVLSPISLLAQDVNSDGYNDNDFNKIQAFLDQPSSVSGKTNGACINTASYNSADPTTWIGVTWSSDTEKRVTAINWCGAGLAGNLDISNFTSLTSLDCYDNEIFSIYLFGDTALSVIDVCNNNLTALNVYSSASYICCGFNNISALDVGNPSLNYLYCESNNMTQLNLTGSTSLLELYCDHNSLTGTLDVSAFNNLHDLYCNNNELTALKLSSNWYSYLYTQNNKIKSITTSMVSSGQTFTAIGDGYISLNMDVEDYEIYLLGEAYSNCFFYNWTMGSIEVSKSPIHYINPSEPSAANLTANFKPGLTSSPADGVIYEGGRISLTPLINGGTWQYDDDYLLGNFAKADKPEFKGLKTGKTTVKYTIDDYDYEEAPGDIRANSTGSAWSQNKNTVDIKADNSHKGALVSQRETDERGYSVAMEITIKDTLLPQTGQNFIPVIVLGSIGIIMASTLLLIRRKTINHKK